MSTLIIGAGIAGLLAATELAKAGQQVTVLEKRNIVGGRMATRQISSSAGASADYGAQFFTVRNPLFQQQVDNWLTAGIAVEWCRGFAGIDGHPRYRGSTGMSAIPKFLATSLNIHTQTKVLTVLQENNHWAATTESGTIYQANNLIMTSPIPQSLALLDTGLVQLPAEARQKLEAIRYDPCFALIVLLKSKSSIPAPGGVQVQGEIIDWIGDNQQKGISNQTTVTIHASTRFTRQHLNTGQEKVAKRLIDAACTAGYINANDILNAQTHRWLYAKPVDLYPDRCLRINLNGLPILFAGDAFKHARVEGAALSGLAAAAELIG